MQVEWSLDYQVTLKGFDLGNPKDWAEEELGLECLEEEEEGYYICGEDGSFCCWERRVEFEIPQAFLNGDGLCSCDAHSTSDGGPHLWNTSISCRPFSCTSPAPDLYLWKTAG